MLSESVRDGTDAANQVVSGVDVLMNAYSNPPPYNSATQEEDWLGQSANQLASAMSCLVQSTRCIAANSQSDSDLLQKARLACQLAYQLVCESRKLEPLHVNGRSDDQTDLLENNAKVSKTSRFYFENFSSALSDCLQGLPGQKELSEASRLIERHRKELVRFAENPTVIEYNPNEQFGDATQAEFTGAAVEFNQVCIF